VTPNYLLCDRCEKQTSTNSTIFVKTGRRATAAGDMEDAGYETDLCLECLKFALEYMMNRGTKPEECKDAFTEWVAETGTATR
jgi:hypothetical protein